MDAGFIPALPFHHGHLEPDCVERRGFMRGIKIPLHDFALKMQGGLMREGGPICGTLRYYQGSLPLYPLAVSMGNAC